MYNIFVKNILKIRFKMYNKLVNLINENMTYFFAVFFVLIFILALFLVIKFSIKKKKLPDSKIRFFRSKINDLNKLSSYREKIIEIDKIYHKILNSY